MYREVMSKSKSLSDYEDISEAIKESYKFKPEKLIISELKWKYLVRSGLRGKNILLVGPTGSGKTLAAQSLVKSLGREDKYFYINMGATQDPRAALIGNTHFSKADGTFFDESAFVKAIKTPNAVILLDELSRGHPEAWNILVPVLDELQRYLRLDEKQGSEIVRVAEGVSFIATANIGSDYTATRVMDRALLDRFQVKIEMDTLTEEQEKALLRMIYPSAEDALIDAIAGVTTDSRKMEKDDQLSKSISTRAAVEMAGMAVDGFSLLNIMEAVVYPDFDDSGGIDSERTLIKQAVQKYIVNVTASNPFGTRKVKADDDSPPY